MWASARDGAVRDVLALTTWVSKRLYVCVCVLVRVRVRVHSRLCHQHQWCTNHDEAKYNKYATAGACVRGVCGCVGCAMALTMGLDFILRRQLPVRCEVAGRWQLCAPTVAPAVGTSFSAAAASRRTMTRGSRTTSMSGRTRWSDTRG